MSIQISQCLLEGHFSTFLREGYPSPNATRIATHLAAGLTAVKRFTLTPLTYRFRGLLPRVVEVVNTHLAFHRMSGISTACLTFLFIA